MKRIAFTLTIVAVIFTCGLTYAQPAAVVPNVEYEKLKVLEPLIGTWRIETKDDETGAIWEALITVSWSATQKMIVSDVKTRNADSDSKLGKQEFQPFQEQFFVWNPDAKRIEFINVNLLGGAVYISEAKIDANGVISYPRIRSTRGRFLTDRTDEVTDSEWTVKFYEGKSETGEALEDYELRAKRVKKAK